MTRESFEESEIIYGSILYLYYIPTQINFHSDPYDILFDLQKHSVRSTKNKYRLL